MQCFRLRGREDVGGGGEEVRVRAFPLRPLGSFSPSTPDESGPCEVGRVLALDYHGIPLTAGTAEIHSTVRSGSECCRRTAVLGVEEVSHKRLEVKR